MKFTFLKKKPNTFDFEVTRICKCCNHVFKGMYCNFCGEKVREPYERSLLNFFDSLLNAFTFLDGKFLKSLKLLLTRPGELSRNIADGKRVPYMKMVSLFFVANFFYFILPTFDTFNSSLYTQMNSLGSHSIRATEIVEKRLNEENVSLQQFQERYQAKSTNYSKLLIVLLVLAFTIVLSIINYSKKNFFFDHLLLALEFYSFHLLFVLGLITSLLLLLVYLAGRIGWNWSPLLADINFSLMGYGIMMYFLVTAHRIFYNQKWYWAILKAVLLIYLMNQSIHLYRKMLFYLTMNSI